MRPEKKHIKRQNRERHEGKSRKIKNKFSLLKDKMPRIIAEEALSLWESRSVAMRLAI